MSTPHYLRGRKQTAYEQMRSAEEISYALLRTDTPAEAREALARGTVEMYEEAESRLAALREIERRDRENGRIG